MNYLLYDYYPTLSAAKQAKRRIESKGFKAVIQSVFMSDYKAVYIKGEKHEYKDE